MNETKIAKSVEPALLALGAHLRRWREAQPDSSPETWAMSLGCSRVTLWRMEQGKSGIKADYWIAALSQMGVLNDVLRAAEPSLFDATAEQFGDYG